MSELDRTVKTMMTESDRLRDEKLAALDAVSAARNCGEDTTAYMNEYRRMIKICSAYDDAFAPLLSEWVDKNF